MHTSFTELVYKIMLEELKGYLDDQEVIEEVSRKVEQRIRRIIMQSFNDSWEEVNVYVV